VKSPRTDAERRDEQRSSRTGRRMAAASLLVVHFALALPAVAGAAGTPGRHLSLALLGGSAQPVGQMADYQWDVRPHAAWGAQVLAGSGPWSAGARWWRGGTTQGLGLAGVGDPAVRTSSLELLARARVARWRNVELAATASGGRLAITWDPERLTVDAGGSPVTVTLSALHEWVAGAGVAVAVPLARGWTWGVEAERRVFALDTAHRSGGTVSLARETFGDWDARVALAHGWTW
jgi:hypothetical protein